MTRARDCCGKFIKEHGMKGTKLYRVWCSMKERCNNPHNKSYKDYGVKGIGVCEDGKLLYRINNVYSIEKTLEKGDNRYGNKRFI